MEAGQGRLVPPHLRRDVDSWGRTPLEKGVVSVWVHGSRGKDAPLPEKSLREK